MFDQEDDVVQRVIQQLRRPVGIDPALDARVMQAIATPRPPARGLWPWLAAAAVLVSLIIGGRGPGARRPRPRPFSLSWSHRRRIPYPSLVTSTTGTRSAHRCAPRMGSGRPSSNWRRDATATHFS